MKKNNIGPVVKLTTVAYLVALFIGANTISSCSTRVCKDVPVRPSERTAPAPAATTKDPAIAYKTLTSVMTVANISMDASGVTEVIFNENTGFFNVEDAATIASLKEAFSKNIPMQITFDPWQHVVVKVAAPSIAEGAEFAKHPISNEVGSLRKIDLATTSPDDIDQPSELAVINKTTPGLTNVIPDFATAQLMFDYITKQCCAVPGPYAIDYCIPFQYCMDGCYARAHKMCWIINKKYNYGTKKIFSFANAGNDRLCVQGQKWGGCCITWWYHVAPLVTIQTPTGPKAYVFDPAMFNQPVLLSQWLHAQENPACCPAGKTPNVSMINVQPTTSYTPSGMSGMSFSTDPTYSATNTTLYNYRNLKTCP